jgi:hypothetical protein
MIVLIYTKVPKLYLGLSTGANIKMHYGRKAYIKISEFSSRNKSVLKLVDQFKFYYQSNTAQIFSMNFYSDSGQVKYERKAFTLTQIQHNEVWRNESDKTILGQARANCGWKKISRSEAERFVEQNVLR